MSDSFEKRKIPLPWALPMGFMIQMDPGSRLNASTNKPASPDPANQHQRVPGGAASTQNDTQQGSADRTRSLSHVVWQARAHVPYSPGRTNDVGKNEYLAASSSASARSSCFFMRFMFFTSKSLRVSSRWFRKWFTRCVTARPTGGQVNAEIGMPRRHTRAAATAAGHKPVILQSDVI